MIWLFTMACIEQEKQPENTTDTGTSSNQTFSVRTELSDPIYSATKVDGVGLIYATEFGLFQLEDDSETPAPLDTSGLPVGDIVFVEAINDTHLLTYVYGQGLFSSPLDGNLSWSLSETGLSSPLLATLNPDSKPYPMALAEDSSGQAWLAAAGGMFTTADPTTGWTAVDLSTSGSLNPLFSDIASNGDSIAAVSLLPLSILPSQYSGLLSGRVFFKSTGQTDWEELSMGLESNYTAAVALSDTDDLYVGTLDQGVWHYDNDSWSQIDGGPSDVIALEWDAGGLSVGSASRGVWRYQNARWSQVGEEPVTGLSNGAATGASGTVWHLEEGEGTIPETPQGSVYIALSFHTNFYHSYRGDSVDDEGFGVDIDVIRNTLDWLDAHPYVRGNWDMDNAFTTDDWMVEHAPDIISRISERVANGQDEVRLMSWNNGAMASSTEAEFAESISRAFESNQNTFGSVVNGVQPQECMFSPDHLQWYPDNGVEWITLFYAANGFTALRSDITLDGIAQHNPVTLTDPLTDASMTLVPVYHHADVLDHGGLSGWAKQLSQRSSEDQLLVVHFDADAESWESFALELDSADALDFVEWTNISTYLETHDPVETVEILGDVADGTGDGFQSWAEKDFNHRQFTEVLKARQSATLASFLSRENANVQALLDEAMTPRLKALSTTNYGLAAPFLHEDRVASATAQAEEARTLAEQALSTALENWPVDAGSIQVVNPRPSSGMTLLEFDIILPPETWTADRVLTIVDETDQLIPLEWSLQNSTSSFDSLRVQLVANVAPESISTWRWLYRDGNAQSTTQPPTPTVRSLRPPLLGCDAIETEGTLTETITTSKGIHSSTIERWSLSTCGSDGNVFRELEHWNGLDGTILRINATVPNVPELDKLETVALSPLGCTNGIEQLIWQSYAGHVRTRPARSRVETWNGQSADGWVGMRCGDGIETYVAHRSLERSSMAFAPIRNMGTDSFMAPLGTIWGDGPWHFGRQTGGHGIGEITTSTVGSQFRPAAPDWSGQSVSYTLLLTDGSDTDVLDLFAHPPLIRVGESLTQASK